MPIPGGGTSSDLGLGDISNAPGGPGDVARLKLLELLNLQDQGKRNANASVLGDILKAQTDRGKEMADSYAPGTKYEAGFEPAGVFDAMSAFSRSMGGPGFQIDPSAREINPQHLEDMGSSIDDALAIMKQITDANGDSNVLRDTLMASLADQLMPKTGAGGATGDIQGGKPSGGASPRYDQNSGAAGAAHPRPETPGFAAPGGTPAPQPQSSSSSGDSKGGGQVGGTDRRTLAADLGSVLDSGAGAYGSYHDTVNSGIKGLTDYLGLTGGGGGSKTPEVASGDLSAEATAAMVAQIMQRAANTAPTAGPNKTKWGANTPGSKHPTGYQDGSQVFEGPTVIRVGERSPKDKKYATEEVVYAAPGTIVAPVPKGMENPSHEDATGLLVAQALKSGHTEVARDLGVHDSKTGSVTSSASAGRANAMSAGSQFTNQFSNYRSGQQQRQLQERQMFINRDQGNRGLDLTDQNQRMNYDLGLRNWMLGNKNADNNYNLGKDRLSLDSELGRGNLQLGRDQLNLNIGAHQDEVRNWEAERALKRELGMRGLDIDQQRANQDYQISSAQMAFQQIMAGITGSALPGVRAGRTPQLSLLG